jgi:hypothetical protein
LLCRSWLASEGARKGSTRLEGLFAGKPVPAVMGGCGNLLKTLSHCELLPAAEAGCCVIPLSSEQLAT